MKPGPRWFTGGWYDGSGQRLRCRECRARRPAQGGLCGPCFRRRARALAHVEHNPTAPVGFTDASELFAANVELHRPFFSPDGPSREFMAVLKSQWIRIAIEEPDE